MSDSPKDIKRPTHLRLVNEKYINEINQGGSFSLHQPMRQPTIGRLIARTAKLAEGVTNKLDTGSDYPGISSKPSFTERLLRRKR